jgi:hypothetical protein
MSRDPFPVFNIQDATLQPLWAERPFPMSEASNQALEPATPAKGPQQWKSVHDAWETPALGTGKEGQAGFVSLWAKTFGWAENILGEISSSMPGGLRDQKRFDKLFIAAPLLTKG